MGLSSAGITNCEFHAGRAEKILPWLLKSKEGGQPIVAVVNPPRAGLRTSSSLGSSFPYRVKRSPSGPALNLLLHNQPILDAS